MVIVGFGIVVPYCHSTTESESVHTLAEGVGDVEQKEARASHRWNTSGACPLTAARTERIGVSADAVILCLYVFLRLAAMPHGCNCRGTYRASHRRLRGAIQVKERYSEEAGFGTPKTCSHVRTLNFA